MKVVKRDGSEVKFNPAKIKSAICKAFDECNEVPDDSIISNIIQKVEDKLKESKLSVEDIQDMIVVDLINSHKNVGMAYQSYRALRADDRVRNYEAIFERMESITIEGDDENSNKNYTLPSVIRDTIAGEYFRNTLDKRVPKKVYQAHKNIDIWYHDSDFDNKFTNCLHVDTEFITSEGVKSFNDFNDGDIIKVLTPYGKFENAKVRKYGKQELYNITISKGRMIYNVIATKNHRWLLKDNSFTDNLKIGDSLYIPDPYFNNFNVDLANIELSEFWCRGMILGDGSLSVVDGKTYTRLRLCGHKKSSINIFERCGFSINKDNYTKSDYLVHIPGDYKSIPIFENEKQIQAYVAGFLFADGGIKKDSETMYRSIYAKDLEVQKFIRKYFPTAGVFITGENDLNGKATNFGNRNGSPVNFTILTQMSKKPNSPVKIKNIQYYGVDNVWCLEVDNAQSFVLPNGITTGNCCLVNLEDMLENGTKITNADIDPPKSIQTAMNIANQIVASVSSVQYGGVSLSNFNEILAKYAKMNFVKNFKDYFEFMYDKPYDDNLIISSDNEELKNKYNKVFTKTLNKTDKDIYDACQLYEYQTNSVLGNSSQTPFSTITFNIPTSWESERIILNYLEVRMKGLGSKGITALFPKLSLIVVDGYNLKEGDKYYYILEKASECIAKTYYPDILNYSKEDYDNGKYYGRMGKHIQPN